MHNTTRRTAATTLLAASTAGLVTFIAPHAAGAESPAPIEAEVVAPVTVANLNKALSVSWTDATPGAVAYHVIATKGVDSQGLPVIKGQQIVAGDIHQTTIDGLVNGTKYDVFVTPLTVAGYGESSDAVQGTPDAEADAATVAGIAPITDVTKGNGFVTIGWDAPESDGGSPIVGYSVIAVDQASGKVAQWRNVRADLRNASLSGLAGGKTYDLYVLADNAVGFGKADTAKHAALSSASTIAPKVATVGWVSATAVGDNAVVSFGPASENGEAVTKYHVVVIQNDELTAWKVVDASQRQVVVPLGDEGAAEVYVFAQSASGYGAHTGEGGELVPVTVSKDS